MEDGGRRALPGADLIDRALEASVLGSFSRIGYLTRRSLGLIGPLERIDGRSLWITGGSSGLGLETAMGVARLGARVRLVVRDAGRGAEAKRRIEEATAQGTCASRSATSRRVRRCARSRPESPSARTRCTCWSTTPVCCRTSAARPPTASS
jgi:hypothetical protein